MKAPEFYFSFVIAHDFLQMSVIPCYDSLTDIHIQSLRRKTEEHQEVTKYGSKSVRAYEDEGTSDNF